MRLGAARNQTETMYVLIMAPRAHIIISSGYLINGRSSLINGLLFRCYSRRRCRWWWWWCCCSYLLNYWIICIVRAPRPHTHTHHHPWCRRGWAQKERFTKYTRNDNLLDKLFGIGETEPNDKEKPNKRTAKCKMISLASDSCAIYLFVHFLSRRFDAQCAHMAYANELLHIQTHNVPILKARVPCWPLSALVGPCLLKLYMGNAFSKR